jgi:hypothetical protein
MMQIKYEDWYLEVGIDYVPADPAVGWPESVDVCWLYFVGHEDDEELSDFLMERYNNDPKFKEAIDKAVWALRK